MSEFSVLVLIGLIAIGILYFVISRRWQKSPHEAARTVRWILSAVVVPVAALFVLLLIASAGGPGLVAVLLGMAFVLGLVMFWIREIVNLMWLSDDAFPGRNDKMLWLALVVLLPPIGVPAFSVFRRTYWTTEKSHAQSAFREVA